jgi:FAD:protein FMN transferase
VSVIAPTAMQADAWATSLMVLGPVQGFTLANKHKIAATFVLSVQGTFLVETIAWFPKSIKP